MWQTKWGRCIYTSPSGYKVYQNLLYRWLTLGSPALQTVLNRYKPHKPVLYYLPGLTLMLRHQPAKTCLLGLGGAGVVHMLNKFFPYITAIDNSQEVIEIAKEFFWVDKLQGLEIVHANGVDYLSEEVHNFTHILVDLYDAQHFPKECANEDFFKHCKKSLTTDGFLVVNLANHQEQLSLLQLIKKQFKHTLVIPVKKCANVIILASMVVSEEEFLQSINQTNEIKKISWMQDWGLVGALF